MTSKVRKETELAEDQKPLITISDTIAQQLAIFLSDIMSKMCEDHEVAKKEDLSLLVNSVCKFNAYCAVIIEDKFNMSRDEAIKVLNNVSKTYTDITHTMVIKTVPIH